MGVAQSSTTNHQAQANTSASAASLPPSRNSLSLFPGKTGAHHTTPSHNSHNSHNNALATSSGVRLKEHKRHGFVVVRVQSGTVSRRGAENNLNHVITPKGAILYGSLFNPAVILNAIEHSGYPILTPGELPVNDSRAHKLLVSYCQGWHVVPFPEIFSRHSGTCYIVGDRNTEGMPYQIKIGDCFRLGSVGLVVSEMKLQGEEEQRIDNKTLQFLKDEALAFDTNEDLAMLASEEMEREKERERERAMRESVQERVRERQREKATVCENDECEHDGECDCDCEHENDGENDDDLTRCERETTVDNESLLGSPSQHTHSHKHSHRQNSKADEETVMMNAGLTNGEKYICYMCYETHNTAEDPLIAPCDCRGDTRFLHVQCLQRWYQSSSHSSHAQVIRTTGSGAPACKICGAAYKTNFKRFDGKRASILETDNDGPYLSLVVVTHHDTNPALFNTKFRLNFGRRRDSPPTATDSDLNTIVIGRSSSSSMVLDYRTVSTSHAKITFSNGKFFLSDNRSSNGTMVYIRDPLPLPYAKQMRIRMGRTTLCLTAKRTWTAAVRSYLFDSHRDREREGEGEENGHIGAATSVGVRTPTVSVDGNAATSPGGALIPVGDSISPLDLQHLLSTLHTLSSDKTERLSEAAQNHDFDLTQTQDAPDETETSLRARRSPTSMNDWANEEREEDNEEDGEREREARLHAQRHAHSLPHVHARALSHNSENGWNPHSPQHTHNLNNHFENDDDLALALALIAEEEELLLQQQQQQQQQEQQQQQRFDNVAFLSPNRTNSYGNARARSPREPLSPAQSFPLFLGMEKEKSSERVSSPNGCNTPPPMVAGSSASIVVLPNVEESHILTQPQQTDAERETLSQSVLLQETMMNSLPVAGVFAIPAHERGKFEKKSLSMVNNNNNNSSGTPTMLSPNNSTIFTHNVRVISNNNSNTNLNGIGDNEERDHNSNNQKSESN